MKREINRAAKILLANILAVTVSLGLFSDVIAMALDVTVSIYDGDTGELIIGGDSHGTAGANTTQAADQESYFPIIQANSGDTVYLSAEPSYEREFEKWEVSDNNISIEGSTSPNASFVMGDQNVAVSAYFKAANQDPDPDPAPAPEPNPEPAPEPNPEPEEQNYVQDQTPSAPQDDNSQTEEPQETVPDPYETFQQDTITLLDKVLNGTAVSPIDFTTSKAGVKKAVLIPAGNIVSFKSDVCQKIDDVVNTGEMVCIQYKHGGQYYSIVIPGNFQIKLTSLCDSNGYCGFENLKSILVAGGYLRPAFEKIASSASTPTESASDQENKSTNNSVNNHSVPVTMTANKAALQSSVLAQVAVYAKVEVVFKKGAEGSSVTTMKDSASANVKNNTKGKVELIGKNGSAVLEPGAKGTVSDSLKKDATGIRNVLDTVPEQGEYVTWFIPTDSSTWPVSTQTETTQPNEPAAEAD